LFRAENEELQDLVNLPDEEGEEAEVAVRLHGIVRKKTISLSVIDHSPCSEGVSWNIFSTSITISQAQIEEFRRCSRSGLPNGNAPHQPLVIERSRRTPKSNHTGNAMKGGLQTPPSSQTPAIRMNKKNLNRIGGATDGGSRRWIEANALVRQFRLQSEPATASGSYHFNREKLMKNNFASILLFAAVACSYAHAIRLGRRHFALRNASPGRRPGFGRLRGAGRDASTLLESAGMSRLDETQLKPASRHCTAA
jgi:hypothetical protein